MRTNFRSHAKHAYAGSAERPMSIKPARPTPPSSQSGRAGCVVVDHVASVLAWPLNWEYTRGFFLDSCSILAVFARFLPAMSSSDEVDNPATVQSSESDSEEDIWQSEPVKRRIANKEGWKKNVAKRKRDTGEAYVGVGHSKRSVAAKVLGPPCTCPHKCYDVVGPENAQRIFKNFWELGSHNAQTSYLINRVEAMEVKKHYAGQESRRKKTNKYSVLVDENKFVVCKIAFDHLHAIGSRRVLDALKKVGETGAAPVDMRGRARSVNKTPDDILQLVNEHVKSLPTCTSHYSRAKSQHKVYLPPGYSQRCCFDLYVKWCEEKGIPADRQVHLGVYKSAMRTFNIGVNPPKCDTCNTCDRIGTQLLYAKQNKDHEKRRQLKIEKKLHKAKAVAARRIMEVYKNTTDDDTLLAVAIDLQQTLATPRLTTSVQYYKRKMWTYNFSIHNLREETPKMMYVWNEATAKRGSSEIGSCLIHYISNYVPNTVNKLIIFSDNCSGQNKNINLSLLLLRFVHSGRFSMIKQHFLMSGHSFLPCDSDFGNLETAFRGKNIYTTPHYVALMKEARRTHPFTVVEMEANDFVDLLPLQALTTKKNMSQAGFKDGRMFSYKCTYKQGMGIMRSYAEDIKHPTEVKLQKGRGAAYNPEKFDLSAVHLPIKYPEGG